MSCKGEIIKRVSLFILAGCIACTLATSGFLLFEYLFFKRQSRRLLELQDDYRTYISAVNKILHDYNKTKEKLDILNSKLDSDPIKKEKKKEVDFVGQGFYAFEFPEGAHVFSSDDISGDEQDSLLLINRDLDYLKESMLDYFKREGNNALLSRLNLGDWSDYTQHALLVGQSGTKKQKKISHRRKRNRRVASYRRSYSPVRASKREELSLSYPIDPSNFWMSSYFGPRKKPNGSWGFHYGLDMAALRGTLVYAAGAGIVIEARYSRGYGNSIVIAHSRKYRTRYAHLDKIMVKVGQKVKRRQLIGKVGSTGLVWKYRGRDPSHLHFEVHAFGKQVNPLPFIV